ncbi:uncharacterized protein PAC_07159 [Phialocephala subalpina]|uniref:Uncharacterized protein n=1 Tax=Phialocephala subalpina TaxID=576137 RepID=A0A1L7WWY6_9HELO|nr:uncharacterized protein PAC_07159 [Phialocephala subalpina]
MSQMPQSSSGRPKNPLDTLQGMINLVLIETGKALRSAQKENGQAPSVVASRLRAVIPSTVENFHAALDDLECDILRAKAVILRDYEELRAKRLALENPEPIIEEPEPQTDIAIDSEMNGTSLLAEPQEAATATIKEERAQTGSPEKQAAPTSQDTKEGISPGQDIKPQNPTPPSSVERNGTDSKPIGLGIVTDGVSAPGPSTAELQNSAIDSLFGEDTKDESADNSALDFAMEFLQDTSTDPQSQDQSQTQHNDFDLENFGSTSQDFSMPDMNISTDTNNINSNTQNKQNEDPFAMALTTTGGDSMDLDLGDFDTAGADDSVFNDIFFGDESNNVGGGEMEHGEFDNTFFGI